MTEYDLSSLKLPVLKGSMLAIFAALLDCKLTRNLILPNLLKQGGIEKLKNLKISVDPTLYPLEDPAGSEPQLLSIAEVEQFLGEYESGTIYHTVRDFAAVYRSGETTPLEVAEKALGMIEASERLNPPLRAFIKVDREAVLAQARESTERFQTGRPLSLFDGVPVIVKDELNLAPYNTHVGTTFLAVGPEEDNFPIARMRTAGALFLGKGNMNEIGLDPSGFNAHFGTVRNPFNLAHDSGGSSSGPGAAVSSGLCPVGFGCDGGGSIRIPSAFCGVVGLKPTFGRVSESCVIPLCPSVDVIGPIGATVEDVAYAFAIMAGPDPTDPRSLNQPTLDLRGWNNSDLSDLVLGIYKPWFEHADAPVIDACKQMVERLQEAGARMVDVEIGSLDAMRIAHAVTIVSEQASHINNYPEKIEELSAPTRVTLALSQAFSSSDYITAQRVRTVAMKIFGEAFKKVDAILTPTTAITAPLVPPGSEAVGWSDLSTTTEKMRYAFPANLAGYPAISFPAGYDPAGMPVGLQAMGRFWDEKTLLRIAYTAEKALDRKRPGVFFDLLRN